MTIADPEQVVLESDPYRRLSYTWHTFTPEWAENYGFSEQQRAKWAGERRSKVTFEIEPAGQLVKLTVLHDDFEPGSPVLEGVTQGWPAIPLLAGLGIFLCALREWRGSLIAPITAHALNNLGVLTVVLIVR